MKKLMLTAILFTSFSAMANYNCSGDGLNVTINEAKKQIQVLEPYKVTINNATESLGVFFGTSVDNKDIKTIMIDTLEGEAEVRNARGRSTTFSIRCD